MIKRTAKESATGPAVLMIISGMGRGGRERQLFEILSSLRDQVLFRLVVLNNNLEFPLDDLGINYLIIEKRHRLNPMKFLRFIIFVLNGKPDIIHYWDIVSALYVLWLKLFIRCRFIDGSIRYAGKVKRNLCSRLARSFFFYISDVIIANSKAGLAVEHLTHNSKARVIYNGIDASTFLADPISVKESNATARIVMVANFTEPKDYKTAVHACLKIAEKIDETEFVFVGDGPDRSNIEKMVTQIMRPRFHFVGKVKDVRGILSSAHVGILLSNVVGHAEGLSNSIMEYMAAGLPVIATKAGGTPELVCDGFTGYLVDPFNSEQVVYRLEKLIKDPQLRYIMGKAGREVINEQFSIDIMTKKYTTLYKSMLN